MIYPIRLNKYLRDQGFASRREADELINNGLVLVNGKKATLGLIINKNDQVEIKKGQNKQYIYLAYNKPRGLATQSLKGEESVITIWKKKGVFPIGRLDKESEGLLILTNDGRIVEKFLNKDYKIEKEYIVKTQEEIREGIPKILNKGMQTKSLGLLLPAKAKIIDNRTIQIILQEGKKHQIRVMLGELKLTVVFLKRIRIGEISLRNLKIDQSRPLTMQEMKSFAIK